MNKTNRLLIMIAILIAILLLFNWKLASLETGFKRYCTGHYNASLSCPCQKAVSKQNNYLNLSKNLSIIK